MQRYKDGQTTKQKLIQILQMQCKCTCEMCAWVTVQTLLPGMKLHWCKRTMMLLARVGIYRHLTTHT